ncbi:MAG: mechanosensitive ion channel family protein [Deltaproteobacteria bacterium]
MSETHWQSLIARLVDVGVDATEALFRIAVIVAAAYGLLRILRMAVNRLEALLVRAMAARETAPGAAAMRIRTLINVLWTITSGFLWFIVVLVVLGLLGINIGPILAGAGVVALAVGFGAQYLVRDLVSGFFLLLENQIRVGDMAIINGTNGMVEAVTFRTVVLRDQAGAVHVFPNGSINSLANTTMDWSACVIDISVSYREDPDRVMDVMRRVAEEMRAEPPYDQVMLEPIEIFGVDNFTDSTVIIKARFKTRPLQQQVVGREYRRRLKKAFDTEGINRPGGATGEGKNAPSAGSSSLS